MNVKEQGTAFAMRADVVHENNRLRRNFEDERSRREKAEARVAEIVASLHKLDDRVTAIGSGAEGDLYDEVRNALVAIFFPDDTATASVSGGRRDGIPLCSERTEDGSAECVQIAGHEQRGMAHAFRPRPSEAKKHRFVGDGKGEVHCGDRNTGYTYPCTEFYKDCPVIKAARAKLSEDKTSGVAAPKQAPESLTQAGASTVDVQQTVGESAYSEGQRGAGPSPTANIGEGAGDHRPSEAPTGDEAAMFGPFRVLVFREGPEHWWIAQGIDHDMCVQAPTRAELVRRWWHHIHGQARAEMIDGEVTLASGRTPATFRKRYERAQRSDNPLSGRERDYLAKHFDERSRISPNHSASAAWEEAAKLLRAGAPRTETAEVNELSVAAALLRDKAKNHRSDAASDRLTGHALDRVDYIAEGLEEAAYFLEQMATPTGSEESR